MTMPGSNPDCWVITDGATGNEKQAMALASALGFDPRPLRVTLRAPWRWLAPSGPTNIERMLAGRMHHEIQPPWPRLLVGCGRQAALVVRTIKRLSGTATRTVQVLDPRRHRDDFDVLVVPRHDHLAGNNVIQTLGAINAIDDAWLEAGRLAHPAIGQLPSPRLAILVGGRTRTLALDAAYLDALLAALERSHPPAASWLVTCSRRTSPSLAGHLRRWMTGRDGLFWSNDDDGANPYAGLLAWADAIVVTPDSSNLLSEACATGKPVFVHDPDSVTGKAGELLADLRSTGRIRPLPFDSLSWTYEPLRELTAIAATIRQRLTLAR